MARLGYLDINVCQPHYIQISAFLMVEADFIDLGMKIANEQSINSSIQAKKSPNGTQSPANNPVQDKPVNASALNQLSGSWAKVKSSQPLTPEQVQKVIHNSQAFNQGNQANQGRQPKQTDPASLLHKQVQQLLNQLENKQQAISQLQLFLTKLDTQQGLLSLLTQQSYPKGNQLLLNLNNTGDWQLQSASQGFSLTQLSAQFSNMQSAPPKLSLGPLLNALVSEQTGQSVHPPSAKTELTPPSRLTPLHPIAPQTAPQLALSKIPHTTLITGHPINSATIKQAITDSGQSLEHKLQQHLTAHNPSSTSVSAPPDFKSRFKQVEQQMNQWIKQVSSEFVKVKPDQTGPTTLLATPKADRAIGAHQALSLSMDKPTPTETVKSGLVSDQKSWLMQSQKQLVSEFQKTLMRNDSFIPSWANTGQFKNSAELSNLLSLLLSPKSGQSQLGSPLWPSNLSAQSQINQTLSQLVALIPEAEKDSSQTQLIRQILTISQSLMKIQHDQIQNRLGQQNELPQSIHMSLPYLHQNQIQWADFEYKQTEQEQANKEKTTGWHLILRFCQDTPESFAVESQLKLNALNVILWATETTHLKKLNQHIPLLKHKMHSAGFDLDTITTKHGSPMKLQPPIQQSLVDVHT